MSDPKEYDDTIDALREKLTSFKVVREPSPEDIVLCSPVEWPSYFTDDVTGECAECKRAIRWRPNAYPEGVKRICLVCGRRLLDTDPEAIPAVSVKTIREVNSRHPGALPDPDAPLSKKPS